MVESLGKVSDPANVLASLRENPAASPVQFEFEFSAWYLEGEPRVTVHALCANTERGIVAIFDEDGQHLENCLSASRLPDPSACRYEPVYLEEPLSLSTVRIPKPWGAEVWYTGIEERGVCCIGNVPLPWVLGVGGHLVTGTSGEMPILLKILDPHPDPVYGDLYFEMHEKKIEVYIVTGIDEDAWPEGSGAIRFGFSPTEVARFESREHFTRAYLDKVQAYRKIRETVDAYYDARRQEAGIGPVDVVSPAQTESWKSDIDPELVSTEAVLREEMDAFTHLAPLQQGDVVRVPPFTPHSLQHGVRVIEFQTPHYERYILSFAQKVLTQNHWDTEAAIPQINWDATLDKGLSEIDRGNGVLVEQAADFAEFEVRRVTLDAGARFDAGSGSTYALVMTIFGDVEINRQNLAPESAVMIPAAMSGARICAITNACLLVALPKDPAPNQAHVSADCHNVITPLPHLPD